MNKTDWENYCIEYIKEHNNMFSVFWATSNKFIANAMDRLNKRNDLKFKPLGFPNTKVIFRRS